MNNKINHIKYFKIENFKRFANFEFEDASQFNLIVGDNNVGKTTLLEALMFNENAIEMSGYFYSLLRERKILYGPNSVEAFEDLNVLNEFIRNRNSNSKNITYKYKYSNDDMLNTIVADERVSSELNKEEYDIVKNMYFLGEIPKLVFRYLVNGKIELVPVSMKYLDGKRQRYIPFVPFYLGYENDFVDFYTKQIQTSKIMKNKFIEDLKLFIPDVEDIEISIGLIPNRPLIVVRLLNCDGVIPLASFGLGAVKLFRLLLEIFKSNNNRIMIDEIDTGIYYNRFEKYWETLLKAAISNNTQIFATTHNWECLEYFTNVLSQNEFNNVRNKARIYTLRTLPNGSVKAYKYKYEDFNYAIVNRHEIRGE